MEKEFFVIVPFDPYRAVKPNIMQRFFQNLSPKDTFTEFSKRNKEFANLKKNLAQRINVVKAGLQNTGLQVDQLRTKELIELFYEIYNPLTSRTQKFDDIEDTNIKIDSDVMDEATRAELGGEEEESGEQTV